MALSQAQKSRFKKKWTVCDSGKWDFDRSWDTKLPLKNELWPAAVDRKVERVDQSEWEKKTKTFFPPCNIKPGY